MAEHKFVYTVSSKAQLSDVHKARIAQAITVAVAQVLAEEPVKHERAEFLTVGRIYGGLWIDAERYEPDQIQTILKGQAAAAGVREA